MSQEENKLSDERLAEMLKWCAERKASKPWYGTGDESPKMLTTVDFMTNVCTELLSRRASAGGEAVAVGEHQWGGGNDYCACRVCGIEYDYRREKKPSGLCYGRAPSPSPAPVVRELEWEDCEGLGLCADTIIGRYWMEPDDLSPTSWQLRLVTIMHEEDSSLILMQGQIEAHAVQRFAQADYERRILSALHPKAVPDVSEEMVERAARSLCVTIALSMGHEAPDPDEMSFLDGQEAGPIWTCYIDEARAALSAAQGVE